MRRGISLRFLIFQGAMSSGNTVDAALRGLKEVKELWLEGRIEAGEEIPEPTKIEDFSGKFVLRIPRSLHRTLDHEARKQGVSLNQYVLHILSERHHFGALQDKIELVLDRLAETAEPEVLIGSGHKDIVTYV